MTEKNNAICAICGSPYHMCLSCKDVMSLKPWKRHTDTAEHYKVYQVIHGYSTGVYDKKEAKSKLQLIDLSDLDTFRDNIKKIIEDIMGNDTKVVSADEPEEAVVSKPKTRRRSVVKPDEAPTEVVAEAEAEVETEATAE